MRTRTLLLTAFSSLVLITCTGLLLFRHIGGHRYDSEVERVINTPQTYGGEVQDNLLRHCVRMIAKVDRALLAQAEELDWSESIARCRAIPGVGPLTAMALVATWHRGAFSNVDAFVAFLGLDVRVRQSGRWQGRRKLTKKGDREIRRLLFNAAMQARRNALWEPYYLRLRDRGLSSTAAFVALSRKLAKVCFALLQNRSEFDRLAHRAACMST
jgi:transposase